MGKHLNLSQRIIIESKLNENISLKKIGEMVANLIQLFQEKYYLEEFYLKVIDLIILILLVKALIPLHLFVMVALINVIVKRINIFIMLKMLMMIIVKY